MQFGLASPIVGLYEKSSAFAVGNDASEACLEARSATGHYDSADIAGHFQALVAITLGGFYLLWIEVEVFDGSVTRIMSKLRFFCDNFAYLSTIRLASLSK